MSGNQPKISLDKKKNDTLNDRIRNALKKKDINIKPEDLAPKVKK